MSRYLEVKYGDEHAKSLFNCSPLDAITELIWNALDADATEVKVEIRRDGLESFKEIIISDNGHGIPVDSIEKSFGWIGASPKRYTAKTPMGRYYHGRLGKGRYKAFALGLSAIWESHFRSDGNGLQSFHISGLKGSLLKFEISDPQPSGKKSSGVILRINNIEKQFGALNTERAVPHITACFASYLLSYPTTSIIYDNQRIDPRSHLNDEKEYDLEVQHETAGKIKAILKIFEWKDGALKALRDIYLCSKNGVMIEKANRNIRSSFSFSAYLCSDYFEKAENLILQEDQESAISVIIEAARKRLREHFIERKHAALSHLIVELRQDEAYPYQGEPKSILEKTERYVFDICASKIFEYAPDFAESEHSQKKLTLGLVKEALARNPSSVQKILAAVFDLPKEQQDDFAELIEKTSLSAIINLSKRVAERLQFLNGFEQILNEAKGKKHLKERQHLQHILEGELWIFGEQYAFTSPRGGDVALKTVLEAHLALLGRKALAANADVKKLSDIPDLCLYRQYSIGRPGEYENLVIEIKRPKVPIKSKHIQQIRDYGFTIASDSRFDKEKTRWKFILVSTDLDEYAERACEQKDREFGHIDALDNCNIWVKRWSQITQEAKGRMEFVQDQLNYSIENNSEGMEFIKNKYAKFLPQAIKADEA